MKFGLSFEGEPVALGALRALGLILAVVLLGLGIFATLKSNALAYVPTVFGLLMGAISVTTP